jgi:hypothetical protein
MAPVFRTFRRSLGVLLAGLLATAPAAHALMNFDGTRNQVFVFGGVTFGYNSNIFAEADGDGDYTLTAQAGVELKRKAGLIGVDAIAKVDFVRYGEYSEQDSVNPNFAVVFSKGTGRTTGSFSISVYRETRSDSAVNLRTSSWNLPLALNLRYPINEKFYTSSSTEYLKRKYEDNDALVDYADISEALDLYYTYSSKLDLLAGYRFRLSEAAVYGRATDHWFNVGATGGLLAKLTGTVRVGYQIRNIETGSPDHYDHWNFLAALNWPVLRKLGLTLSANRDFGTIATGESVDSSSLSLRATYTYSSKLQFLAGVSTGINDFLGDTQNSRRDTFFSWDAGFSYRMNEHFQFGANYTYFKNWSSLSLGDYDSHGVSVNVSSRY